MLLLHFLSAPDTCVMCCSLCPTFAAVACFIDNPRWDGVPFLLKAGKALHTKRAEIRVQFRHVPGNLYKNRMGLNMDQTTNELVSLPRSLTAADLYTCGFKPGCLMSYN